MKKTRIIYWIFTGLLALVLGVGGIFDALAVPEAMAYVTALGYPAYIVPFLGVAKVLGIIAILIPGYPRVKEWAYAGLTFDLIGAAYSHIVHGDPVSTWAGFPVFLALLFGSYVYHHKLLRQKTTAGKPQMAVL
ncbi:DoxX family protein [Chitinophaga lutea]